MLIEQVIAMVLVSFLFQIFYYFFYLDIYDISSFALVHVNCSNRGSRVNFWAFALVNTFHFLSNKAGSLSWFEAPFFFFFQTQLNVSGLGLIFNNQIWRSCYILIIPLIHGSVSRVKTNITIYYPWDQQHNNDDTTMPRRWLWFSIALTSSPLIPGPSHTCEKWPRAAIMLQTSANPTSRINASPGFYYAVLSSFAGQPFILVRCPYLLPVWPHMCTHLRVSPVCLCVCESAASSASRA